MRIAFASCRHAAIPRARDAIAGCSQRAIQLLALVLVLAGKHARASTLAPAPQSQKLVDVPAVFEGEGALQNDSFLPGAAAPAKKIAEGDRAFAKWRKDPAGASIDAALDAWHAALVASALDDGITADADSRTTLADLAPDPAASSLARDADGSLARGAQSIEDAVVRRVTSFDPKLRAAWRARFEPLAAKDLDASGSALERLARVDHDHPATRAAALACLRLFDLAFEAGRAELARAWLARARAHVGTLAPKDAPLEAAIERRAGALRGAAEEPMRDREPWSLARRIRLAAQVPLRSAPADEAHAENRRPRAGIAFIGEGSVAVQCADLLYCVDASDADASATAKKSSVAPARVRTHDLAACAAELSLSFAPTFTDPRSFLAARPAASPGANGARIVVTAGRALGARGNALLCLERSATSDVHAIWGYADQAFHLADGAVHPLDEALDAGVWEFEPGPVLDGSSVVVQARRWSGGDARAASVDEGKTEAWCIAFDLATGELRWKRLVANGAVIPVSDGTAGPRSNESRAAARPAAFLALENGHVFASTGLAIAALLDAADGRLLWSVRSARRANEGARHEVPLPPMLARACGPAAAESPCWLWAPEDGTSIYRLRDGADLDGRGIFVLAPERLRPAEAMLGGDACRWIAWDAASLARGVALVDPGNAARTISAPFEREETAPAEVLLAPERALFATDRALYWCDRTADLAWIDRVPLAEAGRREQPVVAVRRDRIYVADSSSLWILTSR